MKNKIEIAQVELHRKFLVIGAVIWTFNIKLIIIEFQKCDNLYIDRKSVSMNYLIRILYLIISLGIIFKNKL